MQRGKNLSIKDWKLRRIRTTFGRVYLPSTRVLSCTCKSSQRRPISPLKGWLTGPKRVALRPRIRAQAAF
jgi:hypothetical protein